MRLAAASMSDIDGSMCDTYTPQCEGGITVNVGILVNKDMKYFWSIKLKFIYYIHKNLNNLIQSKTR